MDSKRNVLVIGGGAVGLCAAYYLSRSGAAVTVVDKGMMGNGCSLHNAGYISPSHFVPLAAPGVFLQGLKWMVNSTSPLYIKPRFDLDLLVWGLRFARACNERVAHRAAPFLLDLLRHSSKLFDELSQLEGMRLELTKKGIVMLFCTEKEKEGLLHENDLANRFGLESHMVNRQQLHDLDPQIEFRAQGGWYVPSDSHIVPAMFVKTLSDFLERYQITLYRNTEIQGFETSGNSVVGILTSNGRWKADQIVLASGAWSRLLAQKLGINMSLQAGKGYSITFKNPKVKPTRPYILTQGRVAVTPFSDSLRFAGTMEIAGLDLSITRPRVEAILDAIPKYFGNIERSPSRSGEVWAGLRPVTPDGLPYVGRLRKYPNLIAATGHAMLGISLAPVTGKLVAEIVAGQQPSHDLTLLDPNRYH